MVQDTRPEGREAERSEQTLADVMAMMAGRFKAECQELLGRFKDRTAESPPTGPRSTRTR